MSKKSKELRDKKKKKKEIAEIVKETLHSIADTREHLRLNIELRKPNKEK
jgi:hypothetical protein